MLKGFIDHWVPSSHPMESHIQVKAGEILAGDSFLVVYQTGEGQ